MKAVKVSVIMPAYDAAEYLEEAIESVLGQRFESFELLIGNDGSKDATAKILSRYRGHEKIRLFPSKKNRGAAATRNRLIAEARGKYITPCDADDLMLPENLARLSDTLDTFPHIGLAYADIVMMLTDGRGNLTGSTSIRGSEHGIGWDLIGDSVNHGGSMIRKALILQVGGYNETMYSLDDLSLMLKLGEVTKFKYLSGEALYLWRRHPQSMTMTEKNRKRDLIKVLTEATRRRAHVA